MCGVPENSPILDFTIQDGNSAFQLLYDTVLRAAIDSNRRGNNMMYKKRRTIFGDRAVMMRT